jgi:hypothetical protein
MAGGGSSEVRRLAADLDGLAEDHGRVVDALKVAEGRASCALLQSDSALKSCKDLWTAVFELREVVKGLETAAQAQEKLISELSLRPSGRVGSVEDVRLQDAKPEGGKPRPPVGGVSGSGGASASKPAKPSGGKRR